MGNNKGKNIKESLLCQTIGLKLRAIRGVKCWSQEQMADHLGYTTSGYAQIERGASDPSLKTIEKFAKRLEISIIDFLFYGDLELQYLAFHKLILEKHYNGTR
jgi:transcriptional regulator with XRE-family HTH domain